MPNYLRLTDRDTGKAYEGRALIEVDEKLCAALGVPVDDVQFYRGWVDWMALYLHNDWAPVRAAYKEIPGTEAILDWLEKHYSLDGYARIGKQS